MKALQRHAPSALRRDLASSSSSPTSSTTTKHRLGQTPLRAPRRGSIALPARAAAEGNKDPDPGWEQLASKATALALAAAMSMSPVAEVFASTTTTLTPPPTSTSTSTSAATTTNGLPRSLVVTSTIDYERVARARSAMEKRKKRQEEGESGVSQAAATSTGSSTSTTTQQRRRDNNASELPSPDEADALLQFDRDAYTDDAWEAMKT